MSTERNWQAEVLDDLNIIKYISVYWRMPSEWVPAAVGSAYHTDVENNGNACGNWGHDWSIGTF